MKILVVGSLHLDVVLRAPRLPHLDETLAGSGVDYVFGGKGGNQAVAAARMGGDVSFAGRAGQDSFGDMIRGTLRASGVDTAQLQTDPGPSGMSAAIVDQNGDYGAVIVSAANLLIECENIVIPSDTSLVLLQNEVPEAVNIAMATKARASGAQVWLNAAPAREVSTHLLELVDLWIVNRVEAAYYADLLAKTDVLTTLGRNGVEFHGIDHPAYSIDVMSSHGAGDMFVGALAAQFANGEAVSDSISFAQAAAALHVASPLPDRETLSAQQVRNFMAAQTSR